MTAAAKPPLQSVRQVAERFGYEPRYIRDLVRRHKIEVIGKGRMTRFDDLALRQLEEALRCLSTSPGGATAPASLRSPVISNYPTGRGSAFERALNLIDSSSPASKPPRSR